MNGFAPQEGEVGADKTREENFEHAVRRLDELGSRLRSARRDEETMTVEAIEENKWAAVDLPIPENADDRLLNRADFAAMECFNERQAPDGVTPEEWEERRAAAGERVKELSVRTEDRLRTLDRADPMREGLECCVDHAELVEAWQAPAFSFDTISADPWTALYLPIPENADIELLAHAKSWAHDLEKDARRDPGSGPSVDQPTDAPEALKAARLRIAELDTRLEQLVERERDNAEGRTAASNQNEPDEFQARALGGFPSFGPGEQEPGRYEELKQEPLERGPLESALQKRDDFMFGALFGALDPAHEVPEPAAEQDAGRPSPAQQAEDILAKLSGTHSHYEIMPWEGGFAVVRFYDGTSLGEHDLPNGLQLLGQADSLNVLHQSIIDGSALTVYARWVSDEQMPYEKQAASGCRARGLRGRAAQPRSN